MKKKVILFAVLIIVSVTVLVGCGGYDSRLPFYEMNIYDLSEKGENVADEYSYMYDQYVVDTPQEGDETPDGKNNYLGHPDNVMLDNGDILTAYPTGHGRGATVVKRSTDNGVTWSDRQAGLPDSFADTQETPTIYKLDFTDGRQKLVMISGRPGWWETGQGQGFDVSVSTDEDANGSCYGGVWSPHENFYGPNATREEYRVDADINKPITAMAALTRLKDSNGNFIDKWMGVYHDYSFNIMKTYLTFDENEVMDWTVPTRLLRYDYREVESMYNFCEPEIVRSPDGKELAIIFRTNARKSWSYVCFSTDEGDTWTVPQALSRELTGDRHKAEYCPITDKLVISFRAMNWKVGQEFIPDAWFSRGWVAWVGDYDDLKKGAEGKGDFVLKLAHTYEGNSKKIDTVAKSDTGYAGLTIDDEGMIVTTSYGKFKARSNDTYVITKKFTIKDAIAHFGIK